MLWLPGRGRASLRNVFRNDIDEMNLVSQPGEPASVYSRTTSGVDEGGWWRRQMAQNQFLRSRVFELKPSRAQTRVFVGFAVKAQDPLFGGAAHLSAVLTLQQQFNAEVAENSRRVRGENLLL